MPQEQHLSIRNKVFTGAIFSDLILTTQHRFCIFIPDILMRVPGKNNMPVFMKDKATDGSACSMFDGCGTEQALRNLIASARNHCQFDEEGVLLIQFGDQLFQRG